MNEAPTDSEIWPDQRNRGLLQAAKQAEAALTKFIQSSEPRNWASLYEAQSHLRPAIKREEAFRAALAAATTCRTERECEQQPWCRINGKCQRAAGSIPPSTPKQGERE